MSQLDSVKFPPLSKPQRSVHSHQHAIQDSSLSLRAFGVVRTTFFIFHSYLVQQALFGSDIWGRTVALID